MKYKMAGIFAIFAGFLTVLFAYPQLSRWTTILYRFITSSLLFAVIGYFLGLFVEKFVERLREQLLKKGQHVDLVSSDPKSQQAEEVADPGDPLDQPDKKIS